MYWSCVLWLWRWLWWLQAYRQFCVQSRWNNIQTNEQNEKKTAYKNTGRKTQHTHRSRKKLTVRTITTYWKLHNGFYYKHVIASITAAHNASVLLHNMFRCRLAGRCVYLCLCVCIKAKAYWAWITQRKYRTDSTKNIKKSGEKSVYGTCRQSATRNIRLLCCTHSIM